MTKDIGLKFAIDKCGVFTMERRKGVECNGIDLQNGEEIGQIGEGCKHLGVLEKQDICQERKENIRKEYFKGLRATLKSKHSKHVSQAISTWMVPAI